jgi:hypothetical protein
MGFVIANDGRADRGDKPHAQERRDDVEHGEAVWTRIGQPQNFSKRTAAPDAKRTDNPDRDARGDDNPLGQREPARRQRRHGVARAECGP